MLPGFCTCPVDLLASFKGIARILGMAINEQPDLRLIVCQALRALINKSCSTGENTQMLVKLLLIKNVTHTRRGRSIIKLWSKCFFLSVCFLKFQSHIYKGWRYLVKVTRGLTWKHVHIVSAEEEKAEVGRFSKNFLPILFNVYSQQPAAGECATYRMAVLDTIKVYLTVTETQVSQVFTMK